MRRLTGMLLASVLGFAFAGPAWAQSSGPIQTLPWSAKQRSKGGSADQKQDDQDTVQQTVTPQKPLVGAPEPQKAPQLK
ncbi:MAG: hypothetical protein ACKOEC_10590 [Acidimicrobiia bacterium]